MVAATMFGVACMPCFLVFLINGFGDWEKENHTLLIVCFVVFSFLM